MTQLPTNPLSPEQQQKIINQMYLLMGKQVHSFHEHRHMGNNTSVPIELAQDLMESIEYTVNQEGCLYSLSNVEDALRRGQKILEEKVSHAKSMLTLVNRTSPQWQTECRWEALHYLHHYLDYYDHLHLAHKGPEGLFYPILVSPPDGIQGIDCCLFYLNILWIENQIMAGVPDAALEVFWDKLPTATLNQCEKLLINGIGKALISTSLDPLPFDPDSRISLITTIMGISEEGLEAAAQRLCQWLHLKDENANAYVRAILPQFTILADENTQLTYLDNLFI